MLKSITVARPELFPHSPILEIQREGMNLTEG